jgi:methylmalonyl-CoA carboxyltransferase 12S subunit
MSTELEELRKQVALLSKRVNALEAQTAVPAPAEAVAATAGKATVTAAPAAAAPAVAKAAPASEEVSEELLLVLSAAIAAFLGKKPTIRQVRLVSSATWAQQGLARIHASHAFAIHSGSGATS